MSSEVSSPTAYSSRGRQLLERPILPNSKLLPASSISDFCASCTGLPYLHPVAQTMRGFEIVSRLTSFGNDLCDSQRLAQHFNIPHILVKDVVDQVRQLPGEFGEEVRNQLEETRTKMVEEAQAKFEAEKKKKKPKKGEEVEEFDPSKIKPRLNLDLLIKAYKWRLTQNDCQNRGYILDGFPKDYQNAISVFMSKTPSTDLPDWWRFIACEF